MSWVAVSVIGGNIVGGLITGDASEDAANTQAGAADRASQTQLQMFNRTQANLEPWMQSGNVSLQALSRGMGLDEPGTSPLTEEQVRQIYQRYMGRPVGAEEMRSLMASNTNAADLERAVAGSPEHLFHVNQERSVAPIFAPLFSRGAGAGAGPGVGAGIERGSLIKPFGMADFQESPAFQFNLSQGQKAIEKAAAKRGMYYAPATLQDIAKYSQGLASNEFMNAYNMFNQNQRNIWDRLFGLSGSGQNAAANLGGFSRDTANQIGSNIIGAGNAQAAGQIGQANAITGAIGPSVNAMLARLQAPSVSLRSIPEMTGANDLMAFA